MQKYVSVRFSTEFNFELAGSKHYNENVKDRRTKHVSQILIHN